VAGRAVKQFLKTRPPASAESVRRARELPPCAPHPALRCAVGGAAEAQLSQLAAQLQRYRPAATVLEAQVAKLRAAPAQAQEQHVMRAMRSEHGCAIAIRAEQAEPQGRARPPPAPLAAGRFRDDAFFVDATPRRSCAQERALSVRPGASSGGAALREAVLDLQADDAEGAQAQRARVQWDARKRRYVQLRGGDAEAAQARGSKRLRTESGQLLTGKLTEAGRGLYQKWQAKTKKGMAAMGAEGGEAPLAPRAGRGRGRGRGRAAVPNADAKEELRNEDQVRKQRRLADRGRGGGRRDDDGGREGGRGGGRGWRRR
jgi:hypothetical protein